MWNYFMSGYAVGYDEHDRRHLSITFYLVAELVQDLRRFRDNSGVLCLHHHFVVPAQADKQIGA